MKILGFFHMSQTNNWANIVPGQWSTFKESGLYDASDKIYVIHNGVTDPDKAPELPDNLLDEIKNDPKVIYEAINSRYSFEFPTLCLLQKIAKESKEPFYAYYFHSKGAATANHMIKNPAYWWMKYLMHYNITKWQQCIDKLEEKYEACGVEWRTVPLKHFSGNFWWATSEYIKKLPDCEDWWQKHKHDRVMAEMFVGLADPKYYCFKNTHQNLYLYSCTPEQWD